MIRPESGPPVWQRLFQKVKRELNDFDFEFRIAHRLTRPDARIR